MAMPRLSGPMAQKLKPRIEPTKCPVQNPTILKIKNTIRRPNPPLNMRWKREPKNNETRRPNKNEADVIRIYLEG
jgi:hypothetical protein